MSGKTDKTVEQPDLVTSLLNAAKDNPGLDDLDLTRDKSLMRDIDFGDAEEGKE